MPDLSLAFIAFFTSTLAGSVGMGGGILLMTCMPGFVPVNAIVPLHAVTQLASNGSRLFFGLPFLDRRLILPFLTGAVLGASLGAGVYQSLNLQWLPAIIGVLILVITWVPLPEFKREGKAALIVLGFYQTGLGMLAGATGPLGGAVLRHYNKGRDWLVVNTAMYMSVNHLLRVCAFVLMGFSFWPWAHLLCWMILASVLGSWLGTRLRSFIPQRLFGRIFKVLVSVLAIRMIVLTFS